MKIGSKVNISSPRDMYDADGEIIGETDCFWKVKVTNHQTMGIPWDDQKEEEKIFHKINNLEKGFSKGLNTGDFLQMYEVKK